MMKNLLLSSVLAFTALATPAAPVLAAEAESIVQAELQQSVQAESQSVVVLGGGIGALTSALYLARAGIHPLLIEGGIPGGLLTQSHSVQNWPGEMEIEGHALMAKVRAQAEANGVRFLQEEVIGADFSQRPFVLTTQSIDRSGTPRKILAESCIIAMGTTPNFLGIPGEQEYWGRGVTNCAICDGSLYGDRIVGVVGGGDAAVLEAHYLAGLAKEVHLFVRKDQLRANETKRIETLLDKPNVKFHYNTEVAEVQGDGSEVTGVILKTSKENQKFPLDGLFLAIGSKPNSELFKNSLKLDEKGYIALVKDQETSVGGVYAVGDIVDPIYKQAISASGDGAKAALQAQKFLMDKSTQLVNLKKGKKKTSVSQESRVIEITSREQFENELKNADCPVVVDFYATWCGPCKRISSLIESSASHLYGKVKFLKVNVDKVGELPRSYNIRAMPTVILFNATGEIVDRKVGPDQISDLLKQLEAGLAR